MYKKSILVIKSDLNSGVRMLKDEAEDRSLLWSCTEEAIDGVLVKDEI